MTDKLIEVQIRKAIEAVARQHPDVDIECSMSHGKVLSWKFLKSEMSSEIENDKLGKDAEYPKQGEFGVMENKSPLRILDQSLGLVTLTGKLYSFCLETGKFRLQNVSAVPLNKKAKTEHLSLIKNVALDLEVPMFTSPKFEIPGIEVFATSALHKAKKTDRFVSKDECMGLNLLKYLLECSE